MLRKWHITWNKVSWLNHWLYFFFKHSNYTHQLKTCQCWLLFTKSYNLTPNQENDVDKNITSSKSLKYRKLWKHLNIFILYLPISAFSLILASGYNSNFTSIIINLNRLIHDYFPRNHRLSSAFWENRDTSLWHPK